MSFKLPERYRFIRPGALGHSEPGDPAGIFFIPLARVGSAPLKCIVSSGKAGAELGYPPWDHVSVSLPNRCPTWPEMCAIKDLFWDEEDCVVQYHPPKSDHVNMHKYCLHMWRPVDVELPRPPSMMVGLPGIEIA